MKRVVVITGGTGKLGQALAKRLKDETVVLVARNAERLEQVAGKTGASYQAGDVSDPVQARQVATDILKAHKNVDVLVNASGGWVGGPLDETAPEDVEQQIRSNALAPILFTREIYAAMKEAGAGRIVNVVSQGGLYAEKHQSAYAAAKFAMTGFTRSLAKEAKESGVAVGGIFPGSFEDEESTDKVLNVDEVADAVEFVLNRQPGVSIPELGIQAIKYGTN